MELVKHFLAKTLNPGVHALVARAGWVGSSVHAGKSACMATPVSKTI